jgi:hypothetical protein
MPKMFFSNTNTGVVVYHYELEDDTSDFTIAIEHGPDESTTSGAHCAWCGDPPTATVATVFVHSMQRNWLSKRQPAVDREANHEYAR